MSCPSPSVCCLYRCKSLSHHLLFTNSKPHCLIWHHRRITPRASSPSPTARPAAAWLPAGSRSWSPSELSASPSSSGSSSGSSSSCFVCLLFFSVFHPVVPPALVLFGPAFTHLVLSNPPAQEAGDAPCEPAGQLRRVPGRGQGHLLENGRSTLTQTGFRS